MSSLLLKTVCITNNSETWILEIRLSVLNYLSYNPLLLSRIILCNCNKNFQQLLRLTLYHLCRSDWEYQSYVCWNVFQNCKRNYKIKHWAYHQKHSLHRIFMKLQFFLYSALHMTPYLVFLNDYYEWYKIICHAIIQIWYEFRSKVFQNFSGLQEK